MKYIFFIILTVFSLISCSNQETNFFTPSGEFINSNVRFSVIDTISFKMSTLKLDSIITDIGSKILVGQYNDPHFGVIKSSGFVDYIPKNYIIDDDAIFDSIVLNLPYSGYFYNDTLLQKNIKLETLQKNIRYRNGQNNFYNTTNIATISTIGQRSFFPRVKSKDSIKIPINYNFGLSLFNKIRDGIIDNDVDLKLNFKGIKISPGNSENASIIGFSSSLSYIRFYYSMPEEPGEAKYYDFIYNSKDGPNKYFTQISSDRSNTVFPNFINNEVEFFPSPITPFTYSNSGVGIVTKIAFPSFNESIANINQRGFVYKAILKIPIKASNYSKKLYTSDSLQVFIVDQNNKIILSLNDGNKRAVGYVKKELPELNEKYIEVPITNFLQTALSNTFYRNYGLILVPFDFNNSTNRMILNSESNSEEKTKLILTYLFYGN